MQYQTHAPQFPMNQGPYIVEQQNQEQEHLVKDKFKSSKGLLMCLLALPILFFLTCLILFIIMICNQYSSTIAVDHAISTTEQFGKDLYAEAWVSEKTSNDNQACETGYHKHSFAEFQGISEGQTEQITAQKEYKEIDIDESCTGLCKKEPGIASTPLIQLHQHEVSHVKYNHHVCYKTASISDYKVRTGANCPTGYIKCHGDNSKFCTKQADTSLAKCPIVHLKKKTTGVINGLVADHKDIQSVYEATDKKNEIVIGLVGGFSRPCKNPEFKAALPKELNYPLLGIQYTGCDEYGSYDKEQTPELYNDLVYKNILKYNAIDNTIAGNQSPYFFSFLDNTDISNKYKLFAKHRPNVKYDEKCQPKELQELSLIRKYLNGTNRALFTYTLTGLIISALGLLFWFALIGSSYSATKRQSKKGSSQMLRVMHIIGIILAILLILFYIHYFTSVDEDFAKMEKTKDILDKASDADCYNNAGDWKNAVDVVHDFISTALKVTKPLIITFFIIALVYLVLILILMGATKAKGVSPCFPPYLRYIEEN